ncbi:MAG TPA: glycosyltransferase, partial [Phycisphaerae bacterium]|nr:glycosyltransferase [Phycisphaerae bacterium]
MTGPVPESAAADVADPADCENVPADVPVYRPRAATCSQPADARPASPIRHWCKQRFGWRIDSLVRQLSQPDRGIWRSPSAVAMALRLHQRYRFDAIFSSGMPFSDHLTALAVRRLICRPWIADFRDPWVEYVHWPQWNGGLSRRFAHWAESTVIRHAAGVVSVNDHMTARFV